MTFKSSNCTSFEIYYALSEHNSRSEFSEPKDTFAQCSKLSDKKSTVYQPSNIPKIATTWNMYQKISPKEYFSHELDVASREVSRTWKKRRRVPPPMKRRGPFWKWIIPRVAEDAWPASRDSFHLCLLERQTRFYRAREEKATHLLPSSRNANERDTGERGETVLPGGGGGGETPFLNQTSPEARGGMQMPRLRRITSHRTSQLRTVRSTSKRARWKSQGARPNNAFVRGASHPRGQRAVERIYG